MIVVEGSSYLKVQRSKKEKLGRVIEEVEKIKRQGNKHNITHFSAHAKSNMLYTVAKIRRDCLPSFVTLTYPKIYDSDCKAWKRDLHNFILRLNRAFPEVAGIWKLEPQKRGAPHYHLLVWNISCSDLQDYVPYAWHDIAGDGDSLHLAWHLGQLGDKNINCVQEVTTQKSMYRYVLKYVSKSSMEGWQNVGKWWGVFFRERLPFGKEVVFEIGDSDVVQVMRYIRRFTGRDSWNNQSRQMCCDANQWMEKLQTVSMGTYKDWLAVHQEEGA